MLPRIYKYLKSYKPFRNSELTELNFNQKSTTNDLS
jgi:hypothetical protein